MKFADIITLAKAGYKAGEIKELLAMEDNGASGTEKPAEIVPKEEKQPEQEKVTDSPKDNGASKPEDKISELQSQLADLQKQLQEAQKKNTKTDISKDILDPGKVLEDIARKFM